MANLRNQNAGGKLIQSNERKFQTGGHTHDAGHVHGQATAYGYAHGDFHYLGQGSSTGYPQASGSWDVTGGSHPHRPPHRQPMRRGGRAKPTVARDGMMEKVSRAKARTMASRKRTKSSKVLRGKRPVPPRMGR